jgi:hypothetical protein
VTGTVVRMRRTAALTIVVWLCGCAPQDGPAGSASRQGTSASLSARIRTLVAALPTQTGETEGYGREFDIDQHEPARSLVAIGAAAVPALVGKLADGTPTQAGWHGRSSFHQLSVGDVSACTLRAMRSREAYPYLVAAMPGLRQPSQKGGTPAQAWTIFCWAAGDIAASMATTPEGCYNALLPALRAGECELVWQLMDEELTEALLPDLPRPAERMRIGYIAMGEFLSAGRLAVPKASGAHCTVMWHSPGLSGSLLLAWHSGGWRLVGMNEELWSALRKTEGKKRQVKQARSKLGAEPRDRARHS